MRAQCCICSDLFVDNETDIAATPCGHVFHEHCLARWLLSSATCPACRKKVARNSVIPKLYFDVADEDQDEVDPGKLSNELQSLRTQVSELQLKKSKHKEMVSSLRVEVADKDEEVEQLRGHLQRGQAEKEELLRLLRRHRLQEKAHEEERVEFQRAKQELTELRDIKRLVTGGMEAGEEIIRQYASGDASSIKQLAKYAAILKREYEQSKTQKRVIKEQLDRQRKTSYSVSQELTTLKASHRQLRDQLTRSEDDLKQAEVTAATLKARLARLKYGKKHPGESSGSFLDTPKCQDLSNNIFTETPKFSGVETSPKEFTPKMTCPTQSDEMSTDGAVDLDASFDLFADSPQTKMRKTCQENNVKVVKISSAATTSKAAKQVRSDSENSMDSFPLATLNIMRKRERNGQLLGKSVTRKDYNGLGGTSSFTQPLGAPKFSWKAPVKNRGVKRTKSSSSHPALPTLDGFIDLS